MLVYIFIKLLIFEGEKCHIKEYFLCCCFLLIYQEKGLKIFFYLFYLQLREAESQLGIKHSDIITTSDEPVSQDRLVRLEKDCKEQEELLVRFQAENKRLYEEIRCKEKAAKATEEAMFKENQRLTTEITSLRYLCLNIRDCLLFQGRIENK